MSDETEVDLGKASDEIKGGGWGETDATVSFIQKNQKTNNTMCRELHDQGKMPRDLVLAGLRHAARHRDDVADTGFQLYATPCVRLMQRQDAVGRIVTAMIVPLAVSWAQHLAFTQGMRERDDRLGRTLFTVLTPVNRLLGRMTQPRKPALVTAA